MKRLGLLINQVRRSTENVEYDETNNIGIIDAEFIQYMNDAQDRLQSLIIQQHPKIFLVEQEVTCDDSEVYALPSDAFINNKVNNVEYSSTGDSDDYYSLSETSLQNRAPGSTGAPLFYIRSSGNILPVPRPSSGKLRITYIQKLRNLDKRRGKLTSTQGVQGSDILLTVNATDENIATKYDYLSIVNSTGVAQATSLISNGVGTSPETQYLVDSSSTIAAHAIGDYILGGPNSTTHCELPDMAERYLLAYCEWKILKRDSSVNSSEAIQELNSLEQEIVASYRHIQEDVQTIPIINKDDDWSLD